jgi:hypothetical protein
MKGEKDVTQFCDKDAMIQAYLLDLQTMGNGSWYTPSAPLDYLNNTWRVYPSKSLSSFHLSSLELVAGDPQVHFGISCWIVVVGRGLFR